MNKFKYIIFVLFISYFTSCNRSNVLTYYFKDKDFTFKIVEKDTFDVLVLGDSDSIFIPHSDGGNFSGLQFYTRDKTSDLFFELTPFYPRVYRYVENRYKIKFVEFDSYKGKSYESEGILKIVDNKYINPYMEPEQYKKYIEDLIIDNRFWGFMGNCDQGRYTFNVMRGNKYYGFIEPL